MLELRDLGFQRLGAIGLRLQLARLFLVRDTLAFGARLVLVRLALALFVERLAQEPLLV